MRWKQMVRVGTMAAIMMAAAMVLHYAQGDEEVKDKQHLRHVVLFKFKESTAPEKITQIEDAFRALPEKIDTITDFEWGTNNSPEGLAKGFTHCFFVSFADEAGRNKYLPHAAHQEFVQNLRPALEDVMVIDYWARD